MNQQRVRATIAEAHKSFLRCWNLLEVPKGLDTIPGLIEFQPVLFASLLKLEDAYQEIARERRDIIGRRQKVSARWLAGRQKRLAMYQGILMKASTVGRTIGDAFAWLMYHNDRELLSEHARHQPIRHVASGIGGRGELEFIKSMQNFQGLLVLHHGCTTILRHGDISLIQIRPLRVVALAELKTSRESKNRMTVLVSFVGKKSLARRLRRVPKGKGPGRKLPDRIAAQLRRQMKGMSKAMDKAAEPAKPSDILTTDTTYVKQLRDLFGLMRTRQGAWIQCGRCLLLAGFKDMRSSFFGRLHQEALAKDIKESLVGLPAEVAKLVIGDSKHNRIVVSSLLYGPGPEPLLLPGTMPMLWWGLNNEDVRRVVFLEYVLMVVFNPAALVEGLLSRGFEVGFVKDSASLSVQKRIGPGIMKWEGFSYFVGMITQSLFTESQVLELIDHFEAERVKAGLEGNHKATLVFTHVFPQPAGLKSRTQKTIPTT